MSAAWVNADGRDAVIEQALELGHLVVVIETRSAKARVECWKPWDKSGEVYVGPPERVGRILDAIVREMRVLPVLLIKDTAPRAAHRWAEKMALAYARPEGRA
jgi:hypothetical protein